MRRRFTIEVDIDTDTHGWTKMFTSDGRPDTFQISLRRDVKDFGTEDSVIPIVLTHELGHIIGNVFGLPAASAEPRSLSEYHPIFRDPIVEDRVLASENEAWDIAELMLLASRMRHYAIGTYLKAFGRIPEFSGGLFKNDIKY
jgi:hypothetical protein